VTDSATLRLRDIDFDSFELSDEARSLMRGSMTPREFVTVLVSKELLDDALQFLSCTLAKPNLIWWGVLCVWHGYRSGPPKKEQAALSSIVAWLRQPDDAHRRAAHTAGAQAGLETPAGLLSMAVFFSGGSISLPKLPIVNPPPFVAASCVSNALTLCLARFPAAEQLTMKHQFLHLAQEVSEGKHSWQVASA
jgi:hypothetical protein